MYGDQGCEISISSSKFFDSEAQAHKQTSTAFAIVNDSTPPTGPLLDSTLTQTVFRCFPGSNTLDMVCLVQVNGGAVYLKKHASLTVTRSSFIQTSALGNFRTDGFRHNPCRPQ